MTRSALLRTIDDEALYRQLQALLNTMPNFRAVDDDAEWSFGGDTRAAEHIPFLLR